MAKKYLDDTGLGHFWDKTAYKYGIEYIVGTQAAATNAWTGVTLDKNCASSTIPTGKVIVYHLPYAGTSSAATLNLTFPDGTTSGAKNVYRLASSTIGTNFGAGCDLFLVFNGTEWKVSAYQDTDSNNYDRMRHYTAVKAASAVTAGQIIVGTDAGYKPVANGVTFSINYPILYAGSAISAAATNNNTYDAYPGVNLQNTKSGYTGTTYKMTFLVGTLSGTTFTVNSDIFTQTIPSSADSKVYAPIGLMTDSNKTVFFFPTNNYWEYRNGAFRPISTCPTLATVATSGSYNDLSNKPTIPAAQVNSDWNSSSGVSQILNKPTLATVATSGSYNDLSNKPTIPTVNNATLTIQKNGTTVKTFTANASSNVTANITVPTKTSDITNDSNFVASGDLATVATSGSYNDLSNKPTIPTVNNATLTIQKNGTTVKTFTANASSNVTANITVPTNNNELTNGAGYITSSGSITGNAATATKLAAGKTIAIGTGATGTATSFDGSANITIPVTNIKEAYATWGGKSLASDITPDDMGCIDEFGHNKLAFLPAECIEIKYSTDGGSTWTDYGASDANKVKMVSTAGPGFYVGGSTDNATASNIANLKLRVRIAAGPTSGGKVYTAAKKILINVSTQGCSGNKVDIKYRTIANYKAGTETWTTVGTYDVAGGSGWNSIPFAYTFGGSFTTQTSQMGQIEFVFYSSGLGTWGLKKLSAIDFRMIGSTNWTMPSEMARAGHLYTVDEGQNATFPANVSVTGSLKHGNYTYTLPNKNGTVAMTSDLPTVNNATLTIQKNGTNVQTFTANQSTNATANITVPTKTSDLTNNGADNTSTYIETDDAQILAAGQGDPIPCFDGMTPIQTFTWTVADTTYRPVYQMNNTGLAYDTMDADVAYRITVTGTGISQVCDIHDRWFSPTSWPLTSALNRTLSTSAATTGFRYLRAVYPKDAGLNNNTYKLGSEIANYDTTSRTIKVEVFKTNANVTWNATKPSGPIYTSSTYQSTSAITTYSTRGWILRQPAYFYATNASSADSATRITSYEGYTVGSSAIKSGATALVADHLAYLADDGLVYDISNTTKNMVCDENGKVGLITTAINASTAIGQTYFRSLTNLNSTQVGTISHATLALGNRVYLRCTRDSSGNIHSGNYLATSMAAGYTWLPLGVATATNTIYMDTRRPTFYTLDSNGKLTHVNGKAVAGTTYTAGAHINITGSTIKAVDYVHSDSPVSTSSVTPIITNQMITDGTITFSKTATGEFLKLQTTTTDPGAGSALAANTLLGVYEA